VGSKLGPEDPIASEGPGATSRPGDGDRAIDDESEGKSVVFNTRQEGENRNGPWSVEEVRVNGLVLTVSSRISNLAFNRPHWDFVCDHFDEGKWLRCMAFFQVSPEHYRDMSFRIRGFSRLVFGYQLLAVYLMLQMERRTGGGFLGGEMELGKTTEMILYMSGVC
jgi:hypothetical protein